MSEAIITIKQLRDAGACASACWVFQSLFGEQAVVTEKAAAEAADRFPWSWASERLLEPEHHNAFMLRSQHLVRNVGTPLRQRIYDEFKADLAQAKATTRADRVAEVCSHITLQHRHRVAQLEDKIDRILARLWARLYIRQSLERKQSVEH